jgi:hypothetical protein
VIEEVERERTSKATRTFAGRGALLVTIEAEPPDDMLNELRRAAGLVQGADRSDRAGHADDVELAGYAHGLRRLALSDQRHLLGRRAVPRTGSVEQEEQDTAEDAEPEAAVDDASFRIEYLMPVIDHAAADHSCDALLRRSRCSASGRSCGCTTARQGSAARAGDASLEEPHPAALHSAPRTRSTAIARSQRYMRIKARRYGSATDLVKRGRLKIGRDQHAAGDPDRRQGIRRRGQRRRPEADARAAVPRGRQGGDALLGPGQKVRPRAVRAAKRDAAKRAGVSIAQMRKELAAITTDEAKDTARRFLKGYGRRLADEAGTFAPRIRKRVSGRSRVNWPAYRPIHRWPQRNDFRFSPAR